MQKKGSLWEISCQEIPRRGLWCAGCEVPGKTWQLTWSMDAFTQNQEMILTQSCLIGSYSPPLSSLLSLPQFKV